MTEWRAGRRFKIAVFVARFTSFHECNDLTTNARPPKSLRYALKSGLVALVCKYMYSATNFFFECNGQDDSSGNRTFVDMVQESFLLRGYLLHRNMLSKLGRRQVCLNRGVRSDLLFVSRHK